MWRWRVRAETGAWRAWRLVGTGRAGVAGVGGDAARAADASQSERQMAGTAGDGDAGDDVPGCYDSDDEGPLVSSRPPGSPPCPERPPGEGGCSRGEGAAGSGGAGGEGVGVSLHEAANAALAGTGREVVVLDSDTDSDGSVMVLRATGPSPGARQEACPPKKKRARKGAHSLRVHGVRQLVETGLPRSWITRQRAGAAVAARTPRSMKGPRTAPAACMVGLRLLQCIRALVSRKMKLDQRDKTRDQLREALAAHPGFIVKGVDGEETEPGGRPQVAHAPREGVQRPRGRTVLRAAHVSAGWRPL
eukprot:jgi/Mesvir1/16422/Mv18151-RA.1